MASALDPQAPVTDDDLLTIPEVASALRCGTKTVYRRIAAGEFEVTDIALPGALRPKTRIPRRSLRAYLKTKTRTITP